MVSSLGNRSLAELNSRLAREDLNVAEIETGCKNLLDNEDAITDEAATDLFVLLSRIKRVPDNDLQTKVKWLTWRFFHYSTSQDPFVIFGSNLSRSGQWDTLAEVVQKLPRNYLDKTWLSTHFDVLQEIMKSHPPSSCHLLTFLAKIENPSEFDAAYSEIISSIEETYRFFVYEYDMQQAVQIARKFKECIGQHSHPSDELCQRALTFAQQSLQPIPHIELLEPFVEGLDAIERLNLLTLYDKQILEELKPYGMYKKEYNTTAAIAKDIFPWTRCLWIDLSSAKDRTTLLKAVMNKGVDVSIPILCTTVAKYALQNAASRSTLVTTLASIWRKRNFSESELIQYVASRSEWIDKFATLFTSHNEEWTNHRSDLCELLFSKKEESQLDEIFQFLQGILKKDSTNWISETYAKNCLALAFAIPPEDLSAVLRTASEAELNEIYVILRRKVK